MLTGYRTYIVAIGAIAAAAISFMMGDADLATAINNALLGAGLATLRLATK
jgi:hypothetical protein